MDIANQNVLPKSWFMNKLMFDYGMEGLSVLYDRPIGKNDYLTSSGLAKTILAEKNAYRSDLNTYLNILNDEELAAKDPQKFIDVLTNLRLIIYTGGPYIRDRAKTLIGPLCEIYENNLVYNTDIKVLVLTLLSAILPLSRAHQDMGIENELNYSLLEDLEALIYGKEEFCMNLEGENSLTENTSAFEIHELMTLMGVKQQIQNVNLGLRKFFSLDEDVLRVPAQAGYRRHKRAKRVDRLTISPSLAMRFGFTKKDRKRIMNRAKSHMSKIVSRMATNYNRSKIGGQKSNVGNNFGANLNPNAAIATALSKAASLLKRNRSVTSEEEAEFEQHGRSNLSAQEQTLVYWICYTLKSLCVGNPSSIENIAGSEENKSELYGTLARASFNVEWAKFMSNSHEEWVNHLPGDENDILTDTYGMTDLEDIERKRMQHHYPKDQAQVVMNMFGIEQFLDELATKDKAEEKAQQQQHKLKIMN